MNTFLLMLETTRTVDLATLTLEVKALRLKDLQ